ncbi:Crp/Fnr family transcriptional regulator [Novimethylophilus kurashikiensis]|nr:Crp/Fnr family transcriptional regulator [Novimethylophilus kurashikiensis]
MPLTLASPAENLLLAALPDSDRQRLLPELKQVQLTPGDVIYESGLAQNFVIFPTSGVVSLVNLIENGSSAEIAMTGNEGVVGVSVFLGVVSSVHRAIVQSEGVGYKLKADVVKREMKLGSGLQQIALRFTQALITQMAQTAVCNRYHTVDQRLCRWLLLTQDRLKTNELRITQENIASLLGVRREAVTEAARKLQDAGLIGYSRGKISILDRPHLETRVCECYAVVKHEYDRLLPYARRN